MRRRWNHDGSSSVPLGDGPLSALGVPQYPPHLDMVHELGPISGKVGGLTGGAGVADALDRGDAENDEHGENCRSIDLCNQAGQGQHLVGHCLSAQLSNLSDLGPSSGTY